MAEPRVLSLTHSAWFRMSETACGCFADLRGMPASKAKIRIKCSESHEHGNLQRAGANALPHFYKNQKYSSQSFLFAFQNLSGEKPETGRYVMSFILMFVSKRNGHILSAR